MVRLCNKNIKISEKRTTLRLAEAEWQAIDDICDKERISKNELITIINANKNKQISLTSSVRLFCLIYLNEVLLRQTQQQRYKGTTDLTPIHTAINSII